MTPRALCQPRWGTVKETFGASSFMQTDAAGNKIHLQSHHDFRDAVQAQVLSAKGSAGTHRDAGAHAGGSIRVHLDLGLYWSGLHDASVAPGEMAAGGRHGKNRGERVRSDDSISSEKSTVENEDDFEEVERKRSDDGGRTNVQTVLDTVFLCAISCCVGFLKPALSFLATSQCSLAPTCTIPSTCTHTHQGTEDIRYTTRTTLSRNTNAHTDRGGAGLQ